ncbi:MAG: hypothetical protein ACQERU_13710 [Bacteroidota bacterium]
MKENFAMLDSYFRIRKMIGILGIFLPFLIVIFHGDFLASISHYYYGKTSVIFTSILTAFGLFLISYKGYEKDTKSEKFSDNFITNIGGIAALLVVIFPTSCSGSNSEFIDNMILSESYPLFGHNNGIYNTIHLLSAGLFLFIMGWMSLFRFTKGNKEEKKNKNRIYRFTAYLIWGSILILALEFLIGFQISNYDVFALETVSVLSFGIAWLIKGKALKDLLNLGAQMKKL